MTTHHEGTEYLTEDEQALIAAIGKLRTIKRATNTSAVAAEAAIPRTTARTMLDSLRASDYVYDAAPPSKNAASWRLTDKARLTPSPNCRCGHHADLHTARNSGGCVVTIGNTRCGCRKFEEAAR